MPTFVLLLFVAVGIVMSAPWQDNPNTCGLQGPVSDVSVQSAEEDDAHDYAWPWMARMYYNGSGVCGASLIDPYWVITAANCIGVSKDPRAYMFRVGSVDLKTITPFTQIRTASEMYIHPEYNDKYCKSTNDNDVALLKMSEPFILTEGHEVNSVCLPTKSMTVEFKGTLVTITGWGKTKKVSPHTLKQVHVPMYDARSCINTFHPCDITENMICAGAVTNSKDICEGDSGGPVVGFRGDNKDQYYLIGIESVKPSLGECEAEIQKPCLYTQVSKHEEYMKTIMTTKKATTQSNTSSTVQPTTSSITNLTINATTQPTTQPTTNLTTNITTNATTEPTTNATAQPTTIPTTQPYTNTTTQPTSNATTQPTTTVITNLTTSSPTPSPGGKAIDNKTLIIIILVLAGSVFVLIIIIYFCSRKRAPNKTSTISICTSAEKNSVDGFINELREHLGEDQLVEYMELPYNNVEDFDIKKHGIEVMILCHSIHNRRFSITDVADSLYDTFLKNAASTLGKERVGVIVHDFPTEKFDSNDIYHIQLDAFKIKQPTTFEKASLVLIAGRLNGTPVQLPGCGWSNIDSFVNKCTTK